MNSQINLFAISLVHTNDYITNGKISHEHLKRNFEAKKFPIKMNALIQNFVKIHAHSSALLSPTDALIGYLNKRPQFFSTEINIYYSNHSLEILRELSNKQIIFTKK